MSWNLNARVTRNDARGAIESAPVIGQDDLLDERNEQVRIAQEAAFAIIESDALFSGDPGDTFAVSLYGHANPEHKDREGWATDTITVSIMRVKVPIPA